MPAALFAFDLLPANFIKVNQLTATRAFPCQAFFISLPPPAPRSPHFPRAQNMTHTFGLGFHGNREGLRDSCALWEAVGLPHASIFTSQDSLENQVSLFWPAVVLTASFKQPCLFVVKPFVFIYIYLYYLFMALLQDAHLSSY